MNFDELFRSFPELTTTGLSQGAIYAMVALGYTLVYGVLKLINFAHSEVFMVGTFACFWVWGVFGFDGNSAVPSTLVALGLIVLGIVAAAIAGAVTALGVEVAAYRPLRARNAPPLAFLITAIGASFVIMEFVGMATTRRPFGMPTLLPGGNVFSIGDFHFTWTTVVILLVAIVMMVALDWFVNRTRQGRGIRAVAQDANTAALMGINRTRVIALVFVIGGVMAGVGAVFYNLKVGSTKFNVGFLLGLKAFSAAVLGGIGNLRGALLGGLLLGLVENYAAALFGSNMRNLVAFIVLVALLMFRPTGLLGESLGRARA